MPALRDAVSRAERGQIDADLGGGVIKQRVARPGRGRSGGYRMIMLLPGGHPALFRLRFCQESGRTIWNPMSSKYRELAKLTWRSPIV